MHRNKLLIDCLPQVQNKFIFFYKRFTNLDLSKSKKQGIKYEIINLKYYCLKIYVQLKQKTGQYVFIKTYFLFF